MNNTENGVTEPKFRKVFHIVYYLQKDLQPVLGGVNIDADNVVMAVETFLKNGISDADDILYVLRKNDEL